MRWERGRGLGKGGPGLAKETSSGSGISAPALGLDGLVGGWMRDPPLDGWVMDGSDHVKGVICEEAVPRVSLAGSFNRI